MNRSSVAHVLNQQRWNIDSIDVLHSCGKCFCCSSISASTSFYEFFQQSPYILLIMRLGNFQAACIDRIVVRSIFV